jgi:hypothetical protein
MKKKILLNATEAIRQIVERANEGDWDDILRIYRAAMNPDAELQEQDDGSFMIAID